MRFYTADEKRNQVQELRDALRDLIAAAEEGGSDRVNVEPLRVALAKAETVLAGGLSWPAIKDLAASFTPVIWCHKEWTPPLVKQADGTFSEPAWFRRLSEAHATAERVAMSLRAYGER